VSVVDGSVYLAGASGGVYALIAAHCANLVVVCLDLYNFTWIHVQNWAEMEFAICRLVFFVLLIGSDVGVALYNRYNNVGDDKVRIFIPRFI
jgi:rhomboid-related protein 1/2/3